MWFDALTNYITAGYADDPARFSRTWPADVHVIGKDILRFHAIYWPAMLMAAGLELPRTVWAHGFLTVGGKKMSKTNATGIHPFELIDRFGTDSYRYYFMREVRFGEDGSFSWESMLERHNADLANGLGNLASRVLAMLETSFGGVVPEPRSAGVEEDLPDVVASAVAAVDEHMLALRIQQGLAAIWTIVDRANGYLVERQPWKLAKDPARRDELAGVLYASVELLRILAILIRPVMPGAAERLWEQLGIVEPLDGRRVPRDVAWGGLRPGTRTVRGGPLFPRIEPD
ncbi:MAG: hypothetical protein KatS3mg013_1840 [Actinomycetota bacterium]|nr:MAG: hypothetical protein KatS3mg013_1840 [Actinomycetota bacterium]